MNSFKGIGRRKKSVARVEIVPGSGKFSVNELTLQQYFPNEIVIKDLLQPLTILELDKKYDVRAKVIGGGFTGQSGAIRLALANALVGSNNENKKVLRTKKLVTRDMRVKERKKYGKHGARRSPQFVKR